MGATITKPDIEVQRSSLEVYQRLERVERLSDFLDRSILIPQLNLSIGADALIGLIPGIGDAIGGMLGSYIIYEAALSGVPRVTLVRMLGNLGLDALAGIVPVFGDVFDIAWKSHARNSALFRSAVQNGKLEILRPDEAADRLRFAVMIGLIALLLAAVAALVGVYFLLGAMF